MALKLDKYKAGKLPHKNPVKVAIPNIESKRTGVNISSICLSVIPLNSGSNRPTRTNVIVTDGRCGFGNKLPDQ